MRDMSQHGGEWLAAAGGREDLSRGSCGCTLMAEVHGAGPKRPSAAIQRVQNWPSTCRLARWLEAMLGLSEILSEPCGQSTRVLRASCRYRPASDLGHNGSEP